MTVAAERLYEAFLDHSLPKPAWTHEAHLTVCWCALRARPRAEVLAHLRATIRTYNEATGVANTATDGYHETITRYYVRAVDHLAAASVEQVLAAQLCDRSAPLGFWSRELLFDPSARAAWVPPDLASLPWDAGIDDGPAGA